MDTTVASAATEIGDVADLGRNEYVSCIEVDGKPILPPIMTEERRHEMKRYKELAVLKEQELLERRNALYSTVFIGKDFETDRNDGTFSTAVANRQNLSKSESSGSPTSRSSFTLITPFVLATSTPRKDCSRSAIEVDVVRGGANSVSLSEKLSFFVNNSQSSVSYGKGVLQECSFTLPRTADPSKCQLEQPSVAVPHVDDITSETCEESGSNFTSGSSSTGTFVIQKCDDVGQKDSMSPESHVTDEESLENDENVPPTVLRKLSLEEPVFKRKRPTKAKYFDLDEEVFVNVKTGSAFTHLPNFVSERQSDQKNSARIGTHNISPVNNICCTTTPTRNSKTTARMYEVTLTKDIPSSAEKVAVNSDDCSSRSSDQGIQGDCGISLEEKDERKHVRKLSYTLATPSVVLLEALSNDKGFVQNLETVPSVPSSVGVASVNQTPEKPTRFETFEKQTDPKTSDEIDMGNSDKINRTLSKLQDLNLGKGKQAHLERFLGDQYMSKSSVKNTGDDVEILFKRIQVQHENKLHQLAEQHRLQELLIKQEFESELEKLKEKLYSNIPKVESVKSHNNELSPNSVVESLNSFHSPRPHTAGTSSMSLSLFDETTNKTVSNLNSGITVYNESTKSTSLYQLTGNNMNPFTTSTTLSAGFTPTDLAAIGLSKLQNRMHMMSPSIFRAPTDARSPLLKGLVFPDPLDKPVAPIRIPQRANDADMKLKFDRLSAVVKGYLTRRLLNTEKVQIIVQTVRDTVDLLLKLYEETPIIANQNTVKSQDAELHQRLIQQLTGTCQSFHDVFFKLSTLEKMALIATDRDKLKAKAMRNFVSPAKRNISTATLKSLERRMSHRSSPKRDMRKSRISPKLLNSTAYGSQSVKPKQIKSYNISPKRRRISYWDDRNSSRKLTSGEKHDLNFKTQDNHLQEQTYLSSRLRKNFHSMNSGNGSDTFLISGVTPSSRGYLDATYNITSYPGSLSGSRKDVSSLKSGSARSSNATTSISSNTSRSRVSTARQPWK